MERVRVALIGVGGRGEGLYRVAMKMRTDIDFVAVVDPDQKMIDRIVKEMKDNGHGNPAVYDDYRKCIDEIKPDAIVVATGWDMHLPVTKYAMEKGVAVALEVGGAYSIESLWELVRLYERTKTPIMMMENCCYGRTELLALNMKRQGLLGDIIHVEGGYRHDLREEVTGVSMGRNHYRVNEYIKRNCDNYPTHEIGPIAKLLDINCGNRFDYLVSTATSTHALETFVNERNIEDLQGVKFNQADVVTTCIKCAGGETVTITLDTCMPRYYSRAFLAQGTKGLICEENKSVYLERDNQGEVWEWKDKFGNITEYYEKYDHPTWKDYKPGKEGHGGMDYLVFNAFFTALKEGKPMPIDVYDTATWMSVALLTEQSLLTGQRAVFPDFTEGKWINRKNEFEL